jgi:hypothetical protein
LRWELLHPLQTLLLALVGCLLVLRSCNRRQRRQQQSAQELAPCHLQTPQQQQ